MGLFEGIEKNLGYGVFFAQSFVTSKLAANKGWGKRADEWFAETKEDVKEDISLDRERVRNLAADVEDSVDDFLSNVADGILSYLDTKYVPSDDEQATAERAAADAEEEEVPLTEENVEDFLKTFTDEPAAVSDEDAHITHEFVASLVAAHEFSKLSDEITAVIARIEAAKADGNTVELERLTSLLKQAGVSVEFRGERVSWHIF